MKPRKPFKLGWNCQKTGTSSNNTLGVSNGSQLKGEWSQVSLPSLRRLMTTLEISPMVREQVHWEMVVLTPTTWDQLTIQALFQVPVLCLHLQDHKLPVHLKVFGDHTMHSRGMFLEKETYLLMLKWWGEAEFQAHQLDRTLLQGMLCIMFHLLNPCNMLHNHNMLHIHNMRHIQFQLLMHGMRPHSATMSNIVNRESKESTWNTKRSSKSIRSSTKSLR